MYHTVYLDDRVAVSPAEINMIRSPENIKNILLDKLREKHEGKCNANGYVRPGSIELLARSMGVAENGRFTGNLMYDCKIKCDELYPTGGSVVDAIVLKVNKMGAYAVFDEAMRILIPRDLHIGSKEFDALKEGDGIKVRIERTRFQTNDPFIMAVGRLANAPVPYGTRPQTEVLTVGEDDEEKVIVLGSRGRKNANSPPPPAAEEGEEAAEAAEADAEAEAASE